MSSFPGSPRLLKGGIALPGDYGGEEALENRRAAGDSFGDFGFEQQGDILRETLARIFKILGFEPRRRCTSESSTEGATP